MSTEQFMGLGPIQCECADAGCEEHEGASRCTNKATDILFRIDMQDESGTAFCALCANDAADSGLFHDGEPMYDDEEPIK